MKTKICSTCKKEFPATDEYWHKMKGGKFGYRSQCKECVKIYTKEYSSTDEYKKHNREMMKKWRDKNPDKSLEINRRCYKKNADRFNAVKRERLKSDPEYKEKVRERERKYVESGRRHEINCKPEMREKARLRSKKRRQDPAKKEHDHKQNAKWREENKARLNELYKKRIKELSASYVAYNIGISVNDLTPDILETKRLIMKLKRELKNNNVKIR